MRKNPASRHTIVLLALEGLVTFDLGCALQMFHPPRPDNVDDWPYTVVTAGERRLVRASDGVGVSVAAGLEACATANTIVVPGRLPHSWEPSAAVVEALRAAHERGARVISICVGAFVLGHAGLLDGRRATTHWAALDDLTARFPSCQVEPDALYVEDSNVFTSAGVAAGLDLCLYVLRQDIGVEAANRQARWNVCAPHRAGGQAQFVETPVTPATTPAIDDTLAWALSHLDRPITVGELAGRAHMSARSLNRHFLLHLGTTPKKWLIEHRLAQARRLLETTTLTVDQIASRSGFQTTPALRAQFRASLGTSPSSYRTSFAGVVAASSPGAGIKGRP